MRACPDILLCPVCRTLLSRAGQSFRCPQQHAFDVAKEGYLNLLLTGHSTPVSGDTKEMVWARRRFLDTGTYQPLADALNRTVGEATSAIRELPRKGNGTLSLLDVGCGDGYYTGHLEKHLRGKFREDLFCLYGMDASKEAARLGARRYPRVQFFVANVRDPFLLPDASLQIILNVFAPRNLGEFARILSTRGKAIVVIPNENHLDSLRARLPLLDLEPDKRIRLISAFATSGFSLWQERSLTFNVELGADVLRDLITMTPSYWHFNSEEWKAVDTLGPHKIQAGFTILTFGRRVSHARS